jgi:hypothetical protein
MPPHITLLAMMIAAIIVAQTIWILHLQRQIMEMRRTWKPRSTATLPTLVRERAPEDGAVIGEHWRREGRPGFDDGDAIVGEIVSECDPEPVEERQYRVAWGV